MNRDCLKVGDIIQKKVWLLKHNIRNLMPYLYYTKMIINHTEDHNTAVNILFKLCYNSVYKNVFGLTTLT